jgi:hypothetical protein
MLRKSERLDEILKSFAGARERAHDPEFQTLWREKALQIQRLDLSEMVMTTQERRPTWQ